MTEEKKQRGWEQCRLGSNPPLHELTETEYSFCETVAAYVWHIRPLTAVGRKLGGGADTLTLCDLKAAWDINTPVNVHIPLDGICFKCRQVYRRINE